MRKSKQKIRGQRKVGTHLTFETWTRRNTSETWSSSTSLSACSNKFDILFTTHILMSHIVLKQTFNYQQGDPSKQLNLAVYFL